MNPFKMLVADHRRSGVQGDVREQGACGLAAEEPLGLEHEAIGVGGEADVVGQHLVDSLQTEAAPVAPSSSAWSAHTSQPCVPAASTCSSTSTWG